MLILRQVSILNGLVNAQKILVYDASCAQVEMAHFGIAHDSIRKPHGFSGAVGETIELDEVLMVGGEEVKIGTPLLPDAKVTAKIVEQGKDKKILVFKSKRRKNYRKLNGHRQPITRLQVTGIEA